MKFNKILLFIFVLLGLVGGVSATINQSEITTYYNFDTLTTGIQDSVGSKDFSKIGSPTLTTGKFNNALTGFTDSNYIQDSASPILSNSASFCLGYWTKTPSVQENYHTLLSSVGGSSLALVWSPMFNNDGLEYTRLFDSSDNNIGIEYYGGSSVSTWYYVSMSFGKSSGFQICKDNNCESLQSTNNQNINAFTGLRIGNQNAFSGRSYGNGGAIDEFWYIEDRECTTTELIETWNNGDGFDYDSFPHDIILPTLTFNNITANNITLINNTFYNNSILFETFVTNTSTNNLVNHSFTMASNINNFTILSSQITITNASSPVNNDLTSKDNFCIENTGTKYISHAFNINSVATAVWNGSDWIDGFGQGVSEMTCGDATSIQYATNVLNGSINLNLIEGDYNISFFAQNNETNVSSSIFSFTVDNTAPIINIIGNLTQNTYDVDFSEIFAVNYSISGEKFCSLNITYLSANESDSNFFINCTDTQTFTRAGLYNGFLIAEDNAGNIITGSVNGTIDPLVNIFFRDENNTLISNYSATIYHPDGRVTTPTINNDSSITLSPVNEGVLDLGTHFIIFDKFGFGLFNASITLNETNAGQDFNVSVPFSRIIITVHNIADFTLVNDTITLQILGDSFSNEYIFTQTLNFTEIQMAEETYTIIASSPNFETVSTDFNFNNQEIIELNLYMTPLVTNVSEVADLIITVVDTYDVPQKNILTTQFLWDSSQLKYILSNQKTTDNNGQTSYKVFLNNRLYNFCAEFNGKLFCETDLTININTNEVVIEIDKNGRDILLNDTNIYNRDFSNGLSDTSVVINSTNFTSVTFTYNNPNLDIDTYCLEIFELNNLRQTLVARDCSTLHSGAISINVVENLNKSFIAKSVIFVGDNKRILETLNLFQTFDLQEEFSFYGLSKLLILFLVSVVIGVALNKRVHNINVAHIGLPILSFLVYLVFPDFISFDSVVIIGLINFITIKLITNRDDVKTPMTLNKLTTVIGFYIVFIFSLVVALEEMDDKNLLDDYGQQLKVELVGNQTQFKTFLIENENALKLEQKNAKVGAWDKITGIFLKTLEFLDTLFIVMANIFSMVSNLLSLLGSSNALLSAIASVLDWVIVFFIVKLYYNEAVK